MESKYIQGIPKANLMNKDFPLSIGFPYFVILYLALLCFDLYSYVFLLL